MSRVNFYCLLCTIMSLPLLVHADTAEIPAPPRVSNTQLIDEESAPEAQTTDEQASVPPIAAPEPPDLPMPIKSGENLEPDITIIRRAQKTIQEYRRNGVIYMVKVIPDKGPAYYLIDINGDGKLDVRGSDLDKGLSINQWKLLEWN